MDHASALVRRVDEDRWLASRFAPRTVRERLVAIYALNHEIARAAQTAREPGLGAIRLAWWREAIGDLYQGRLARAPVLEAFAPHAHALPIDGWEAIIAARAADVEPTPFATWEQASVYLERTAGPLFEFAARACEVEEPGWRDLIEPAALAWGWTGFVRTADYWRARGRVIFPGEEADAKLRALSNLLRFRPRARSMPSALFPAFGYLALTQMHLAGAPSLLTRQLRLLWASVTGRL